MSVNRFFRCQYDSNMMSKFPESLKIACIDSEYVSDRDTVFGKCRNEEKCKHVTHKIVGVPSRADDPFLQKSRVPACQNYAVEIPRVSENRIHRLGVCPLTESVPSILKC